MTWIDQVQCLARTGVEPTQTLGEYVAGLGDRWTRGIDPTPTYDPYAAALRRRVWGDAVTLLATTALRISKVAGLRVGDVDLDRGLLLVARQTYPRW